MSMNGKKFEWDCSFRHGDLMEKVDEHTIILSSVMSVLKATLLLVISSS